MRGAITLEEKLSSYLQNFTDASAVQILGITNLMTTIAKTTYVRSKKLLERARLIPCQICGCEDQTVIGAHSNQSKHGKGRGIKASDVYIASLCYDCHMMIDQGSGLTREQKNLSWDMAHLNTVWALVYHDLWPTDIPLPDTYLKWQRESTN